MEFPLGPCLLHFASTLPGLSGLDSLRPRPPSSSDSIRLQVSLFARPLPWLPGSRIPAGASLSVSPWHQRGLFVSSALDFGLRYRYSGPGLLLWVSFATIQALPRPASF